MRRRDWMHVRTDTPRAKRMAIVFEIAERNGVTVEDIFGRCREPKYTWPRFEAYAALRDGLGDNCTQVARFFKRDHKTILDGVKRWRAAA